MYGHYISNATFNILIKYLLKDSLFLKDPMLSLKTIFQKLPNLLREFFKKTARKHYKVLFRF